MATVMRVELATRCTGRLGFPARGDGVPGDGDRGDRRPVAGRRGGQDLRLEQLQPTRQGTTYKAQPECRGNSADLGTPDRGILALIDPEEADPGTDAWRYVSPKSRVSYMAEANAPHVDRLHILGSLCLGPTQNNTAAAPDALESARPLWWQYSVRYIKWDEHNPPQ